MIITLTKADFSSCKIGTLTTFNVRKSTVIGATVNISLSSVERAGYSVAKDIATITLNTTNYEGHAVKVMMGSTDVSSWYSSGKVTIPANTPITSNITISVSATAVSGGSGEVVDPGTGGGNSIVWYTGYDVLSTCEDESAANYGGFAYNNEVMNNKFEGKQINVISVYISKAGTFTVGVVDSGNQIVDSVVVNISNTGVQTIELNKTLTVNTGCRPFVQSPSDTSKFKYEISNTISGFPTGMDAYVGVKEIMAFPKYNMNINFGYKQ